MCRERPTGLEEPRVEIRHENFRIAYLLRRTAQLQEPAYFEVYRHTEYNAAGST